MMLPKTMVAIAIRNGSGPASALHPVQKPVPIPRSGEILIRVHAAGVNRPDLLQRAGHYPPPPGAPDTLGLEVAGEVVAAAGPWRDGDHVCALLGGGGYAEFAAVDARHALPPPQGVDIVTAAAIPETVFTVYANVFEHGALREGQTFLVHGGTSGIGVMAIQMAKAAGAEVIATARSSEKAQKVLELGADVAVDTSREDFGVVAKAHGGVDVALDMVGAPYFATTLDALKTGGRIVYIASLGGGTLEVPVMKVMAKRAILTGSTLRPRDADEKARLAARVRQVVWPWLADGKVKVIVDRTFPLTEAASAHAYLEGGHHVGKIVLTVPTVGSAV